ncbi:hypothetical protein GCM10023154_19750 [Advenella faeciporci]
MVSVQARARQVYDKTGFGKTLAQVVTCFNLVFHNKQFHEFAPVIRMLAVLIVCNAGGFMSEVSLPTRH